MKYFSTNNKNHTVSFKDAVMNGLAPDGGLYMPVSLPLLEDDFIDEIEKYSFQEIAFEVLSKFTGDDLSNSELNDIISKAFTFSAPLVQLDDNYSVLELFHGPTLAFKDFGARFMSRTMEYFVKQTGKELVILVATSGDTGSAVANGFYDINGIKVFLLYPSGKVSLIQEKQLTTLDKNITALEIEGTFDDCQKLVKDAFVDDELKNKLNLSSANSISIARLLPQTLYYFEAYKQLKEKERQIIFSVPSGNFGNLTAGLIAKKMGLPINKFIAATNANDVFTNYLNTGKFTAKPSVHTISNAMDVGNPSNLKRIQDLFVNNIELIRMNIGSTSYNDEVTRKGIREVKDKFNYVIDPHGAVGYLALEEYVRTNNTSNFNGIVLETAHPAKFKDTVEETLKEEIPLPDTLAESLSKEKRTLKLSNNFEDLKKILLS